MIKASQHAWSSPCIPLYTIKHIAHGRQTDQCTGRFLPTHPSPRSVSVLTGGPEDSPGAVVGPRRHAQNAQNAQNVWSFFQREKAAAQAQVQVECQKWHSSRPLRVVNTCEKQLDGPVPVREDTCDTCDVGLCTLPWHQTWLSEKSPTTYTYTENTILVSFSSGISQVGMV